MDKLTLSRPGYQVLGQNHDYWPEKAVERAQRDVRHKPISLSTEDCDRIITEMLDRQRKEREAREAAKRGEAA